MDIASWDRILLFLNIQDFSSPSWIPTLQVFLFQTSTIILYFPLSFPIPLPVWALASWTCLGSQHLPLPCVSSSSLRQPKWVTSTRQGVENNLNNETVEAWTKQESFERWETDEIEIAKEGVAGQDA